MKIKLVPRFNACYVLVPSTRDPIACTRRLVSTKPLCGTKKERRGALTGLHDVLRPSEIHLTEPSGQLNELYARHRRLVMGTEGLMMLNLLLLSIGAKSRNYAE